MSYARDEVMTWATGQVDQGADDHADQVRGLAERKFVEIQKLERRLRSMYDAARLEGDQDNEAKVIGASIQEQVPKLLPGMSADAQSALCVNLFKTCTTNRSGLGDVVKNVNSSQLELILQQQSKIAQGQVDALNALGLGFRV